MDYYYSVFVMCVQDTHVQGLEDNFEESVFSIHFHVNFTIQFDFPGELWKCLYSLSHLTCPIMTFLSIYIYVLTSYIYKI